MSKGAVYSKVTIFRRLFKALHQRGLIRHNPMAQVRVPHADLRRRSQSAQLSVEQVRQLLTATDLRRPIGIRDRALLTVMVLHGLSVGEIQQLNVASIDLGSGTLQVVDGYLQAIGVHVTGGSCYALRRTYAALGLKSGANISDIAASLGGSEALTRAVSALAAQVLDSQTLQASSVS